MIDTKVIASAHDAMADEYDLIYDLWYGHLFNRVHDFVLRHVLRGNGRRALDVGCGTGFQSLSLMRAGYQVEGFDVSRKLVNLLEEKLTSFGGADHFDALFWSPHQDVMADQARLLRRADSLRGPAAMITPRVWIGDARDISNCPADVYDLVVCCGSVLSFIDDYGGVVHNIARTLRPDGVAVIEVEQRVNPDLIWPLVDKVLFGRLGYDMSLREIGRGMFSRAGKDVRVDYPFELGDGRTVALPLWLFSVLSLERLLASNCLEIMARRGVHAITNCIPSTILHRRHLPRWVTGLFRILAKTEKGMADRWPIWRLGCSVVYALRMRRKTIGG